MADNDALKSKQTNQRTRNGFVVKVRIKKIDKCLSVVCALIVFNLCVCMIECNRPPRFLIDGQTEIVLRLKEGDDTPVGKYLIAIYLYLLVQEIIILYLKNQTN